VSGVAGLVLVGSFLLFRSSVGTWMGTIGRWVLMLVTLALPVLGVGLFEGGYNHALKVVLYFAGVSESALRLLFPAPTYELPNDVWFEVTGVLQLALGWLAGRHLLALNRESRVPAATRVQGLGAARS
jgi:hypothetical protein